MENSTSDREDQNSEEGEELQSGGPDRWDPDLLTQFDHVDGMGEVDGRQNPPEPGAGREEEPRVEPEEIPGVEGRADQEMGGQWYQEPSLGGDVSDEGGGEADGGGGGGQEGAI